MNNLPLAIMRSLSGTTCLGRLIASDYVYLLCGGACIEYVLLGQD